MFFLPSPRAQKTFKVFMYPTFLALLGLSSLLFLTINHVWAAQTTTVEPVWTMERDWGGSATFARLREIQKEGILDVDSTVRALDNFNRLDNQVKELKGEKLL